MSFQIIGSVDKNRLFCSGSFTKLLTTYVVLSHLSEKYHLTDIVDEISFLDSLCHNTTSKKFLTLFQKIIGSQFTIRDLCSFYSGLPYTFDVSEAELQRVDRGEPFKHHSILDEETFLEYCTNQITPVYTNRCKFHYSEVAIIFLGYFIEKVYEIKIEDLFNRYIIEKLHLKDSLFSRKRVANLYCQDLSDEYDYPSIAILDHGYFCYSNGFFTTLNEMKTLLDHLVNAPVFHYMTNIQNARAASNRLLNGLTVELRLVNDDIVYGYEGLSFSGCNIWAYSTKKRQGFLTFSNNEEEAYQIYDQFNYDIFDKVPAHTEQIYKNFIKNYAYQIIEKEIPLLYRGRYQRVNINEKKLENIFIVSDNSIIIRNPEEIKYDIIYVNGDYRIKCKDGVHGLKVGFLESKQGNHYMSFDGTLYKKL